MLNLQHGSSAGASGLSFATASSSTTHRQLLHLESMESTDVADMADTAAMAEQVDMYPRDPSSINKYLADAMKGAQGPIEVPVWFVVVTDPR